MLENIFGTLHRFSTANYVKDEKGKRKKKSVQTIQEKMIALQILRPLLHSSIHFQSFQKRFQETIQRKDLLAVVPNFRIHVRVAGGGVRSREEWAEIPKIGPLPISA